MKHFKKESNFIIWGVLVTENSEIKSEIKPESQQQIDAIMPLSSF
jgi:hypothetical protein